MSVLPLTTVTLLAIFLLPRVTAAQATGGLSPVLASTPRVSLAAGAGIALPFHGDFDFTPWAWDADVRVALSSHVLFEAAVGEWRHSDPLTRQNIPVSPSGGVIGRLEEKTTRLLTFANHGR